MQQSARPVPVALRHRAISVDREPLRRLVRSALDREGAPAAAGIGVVLAGDRLVRQLNRIWRGIDRTTDVLSFPFEDGPPLPPGASEERLLGDVVISVPRCIAQAEERGVDPGVELVRLLVHGVLHVLGHDHEKARDRAKMEPRERALRRLAARNAIGPGLIRGKS